MSNDSTRTYLNGIGLLPLLTPDEEIILWRQIQQAKELEELERPLTEKERRVVRRGRRARKRAVEANLRLVVYIAKKYLQGRSLHHMDLLDLVQEGSIGLMKAVERFDLKRGYKFSTYSYWWIKQAIGRAIDQKERSIRRPATASSIASKLHRAVAKLAVELGRNPKTEEIANELGVSISEMELFVERGGGILSLDCQTDRDTDISLLDMIPDPATFHEEDRHEQIEQELRSPLVQSCFAQLTEQERVYVSMRYGLYPDGICHGLLEIGGTPVGDRPAVSKERARQIINRGLEKLKYHVRKRGLLADSQLAVTPNGDTTAHLESPQESLRSRPALHALPALQCAA